MESGAKWFKAASGEPFEFYCGPRGIKVPRLAAKVQLKDSTLELNGVVVDVNEDGYITLEEAADYIRGLGQSAGNPIQHHQQQATLRQVRYLGSSEIAMQLAGPVWTVITLEAATTRLARVKELRHFEAEGMDRQRKHTGDLDKPPDLVEQLMAIHDKVRFQQGRLPDQSTRKQSLAGFGELDLGKSFCWVQRPDTVCAAAAGFAKIHSHWTHRNIMKADDWKAGFFRSAIVGAPGTGKTTTSERLLLDVFDWIGSAEGVPDNFSAEYDVTYPQVESLRPHGALYKAIEKTIDLQLQYRMDFSEPGNGRHGYETGHDPIMLPQQSLAFRYYFMLCREGEENFESFLRRVNTAAGDGGFELMLANLEAQDVIAAAHKAFVESELPGRVQPGMQLLFHMIFDEAQTGLEEAGDESSAGTRWWFKRMMTAHYRSMAKMQDLVLLTLAGTSMDIGCMEASSFSKTVNIPLRLLTQQDVEHIMSDLRSRLSDRDDAPAELCDKVKLLGEWSGGNGRHLAALLVAAAGRVASIQPSELRCVLETGGPRWFEAPEEVGKQLLAKPQEAQALPTLRQRPACSASLRRWTDLGKGQLLRHLLGLAITQQSVYRKTTIPCAEVGAAGLTYDVLEGSGVIALQPCGGLAPDVSNAQPYKVVLPPLVHNACYKECRAKKWFEPWQSLLYDSWLSLMAPQYKELEDVGAIILKLEALRVFLNKKTCKLKDLLPLQDSHSAKYADLVLKVPQQPRSGPFSGHNINRSDTDDHDIKMQIQGALGGREWAFIGPGNEPRFDWWLILETEDGSPFVIQGQSECRTFSGTTVIREEVSKEYQKRFKFDTTLRSLFVYVTDSRLDDQCDATVVPPEDVLVIDKNNRKQYLTMFGELRRVGMHLLADQRTCDLAATN